MTSGIGAAWPQRGSKLTPRVERPRLIACRRPYAADARRPRKLARPCGLIKGARDPATITTTGPVGPDGAPQVVARPRDVPAERKGVQPLGVVVVQGPQARLEILAELLGPVATAVPAETETGRAVQPIAPVRQDGQEVLARHGSVTAVLAARATTVATPTSALTDGQASHVRGLAARASTAQLALSRPDPAKRPSMASLANTCPVQAGQVPSSSASQRPSKLDATEAKPIAPLNAVALSGRRATVRPLDKPETADPHTVPSVAGPERVSLIPCSGASPKTDTPRRRVAPQGAKASSDPTGPPAS